MNVVKEIQRINDRELSSSEFSETASWHYQYRDTAWIFVSNLPYDLTEGDVICIFSQYGEIMNIELARDRHTGKSKGFAFLQYEDQRSTILAVDNLNGSKVLSRTLRVDHSYGPKPTKRKLEDGTIVEEPYIPKNNAAPPLIEASEKEEQKETEKEEDLDTEDPMAAYFRDKERKRKKKEKKDKKDKKDKKRRKHEDEED